MNTKHCIALVISSLLITACGGGGGSSNSNSTYDVRDSNNSNGTDDVKDRLWPFAGHDLQNTRYQDKESKINMDNVANLAVRWQFTTGGDVSATPAVDDHAVYVPDWGGNLFAIDRNTGALIWSHKISVYTGITDDYARTTPAIAGDKLIFGDQGGKGKPPSGAWVMAVDKRTGNQLWKTQADSHTAAIITQSAVVADDIVYVGVSSSEEGSAALSGYQCCSFRGSVLALNANTGEILWKMYMVPDGYSGGAVWGSTPVVDSSRGNLYVSTGNNYSVPAAVQQCVANAGGDPTAERACISPDNHFDSVLALDLNTGAVKWAVEALPFDAWNANCVLGFGDTNNCPQPAGPDYDFGQGPALFTVHFPGSEDFRELVGVGQKSGQYWTFEPDTGTVVWVTQVGPGGIEGGLQWGSATDGKRIYVAIANSQFKSWNLVQNGQPSGVVVTSGFWSALDAATGTILWQTPDLGIGINGSSAWTTGAVTVANDVVYGCSMDVQGHMYAFNAATGAILWNYASGGSCNAGAAVSDGAVYWGSGYSFFNLGTSNNKFYAFQIPGLQPNSP